MSKSQLQTLDIVDDDVDGPTNVEITRPTMIRGRPVSAGERFKLPAKEARQLIFCRKAKEI